MHAVKAWIDGWIRPSATIFVLPLHPLLTSKRSNMESFFMCNRGRRELVGGPDFESPWGVDQRHLVWELESLPSLPVPSAGHSVEQSSRYDSPFFRLDIALTLRVYRLLAVLPDIFESITKRIDEWVDLLCLASTCLLAWHTITPALKRRVEREYRWIDDHLIGLDT
jgi:hypothetical protein